MVRSPYALDLLAALLALGRHFHDATESRYLLDDFSRTCSAWSPTTAR
jgi:hypothetical protein